MEDTPANAEIKNDCVGCGERPGVHPPVWRITESREILSDPDAVTRTDVKFCNSCFQEYRAMMLDTTPDFVAGVGFIPPEDA